MADGQQHAGSMLAKMPVPRERFPRLTAAEYNQAAMKVVAITALRVNGIMPGHDDLLAIGRVIFAASMDAHDRTATVLGAA